jgi:hypothetical protein
MPEFAGNISQSNHTCELNVETQFTNTDQECGDGINDRTISSGEGRTTSEGECRTIA